MLSLAACRSRFCHKGHPQTNECTSRHALKATRPFLQSFRRQNASQRTAQGKRHDLKRQSLGQHRCTGRQQKLTSVSNKLSKAFDLAGRTSQGEAAATPSWWRWWPPRWEVGRSAEKPPPDCGPFSLSAGESRSGSRCVSFEGSAKISKPRPPPAPTAAAAASGAPASRGAEPASRRIDSSGPRRVGSELGGGTSSCNVTSASSYTSNGQANAGGFCRGGAENSMQARSWCWREERAATHFRGSPAWRRDVQPCQNTRREEETADSRLAFVGFAQPRRRQRSTGAVRSRLQCRACSAVVGERRSRTAPA